MTFDEWKAEPYSRTFEDAWKAGAASRDAEVVSLTNQRDYEYVRAENAEQERDQLREQVTELKQQLYNLQFEPVLLSEWQQLGKERDEWKARADVSYMQRDELERDLLNLVCRIHRDGGHYIAKYGEAKAIADANTVAAQNNADLDALQADNAELVAALDAMHNDSEECLDFDEFTAMLVPMDIWHGVFEVLDKVRKQ